MNVRLYLTFFILCLFSLSALSQYVGPRANVVTTVTAARKAADDTPVVLEGNIVRQIKDDQYEFKDATGKIVVEIDRDKWPAQVSQGDKVRLFGEVDRGLGGVEIEVDRVEVISVAPVAK